MVCVIPAKETKETSQVFEQRFGSAIKTIVATVPNPNRSFFSVANSQAGKSGSLKFWADQNGIDHRSVLAVGDNYNDLNMLKSCDVPCLVFNDKFKLDQINIDNLIFSNMPSPEGWADVIKKALAKLNYNV